MAEKFFPAIFLSKIGPTENFNQQESNPKKTDLFIHMEKIRKMVRQIIVESTIYLKEHLVVGSNERIHISNDEITQIKKVEQGSSVFGKPKGLWYGFGDSWIYFSKTGFSDDSYHSFKTKKFGYKIYPNLSRIVILKTEDDVYNFVNKYLSNLPDNHGEYNINWQAVARDYSGIEIPTYDELGMRNWHENNKKLFWWLYPWDVPSGCIWSPDGVAKIRSL